MKIKSLLSVLLSLAMVISLFSLAGCGSDKPEKLKPTNDGDTTTTLSGIDEYKGTTVTFATWVDHSKSEAAATWASFTEKYDITIKTVNIGQWNYVNKLSGLVAAGQSPDIIVENGNFPALFPVAQRLDEIKTFDLKDDFWDQNVINYGSINGVPYFINAVNTPWTFRGCILYNKKVFEDNGIKSPMEFYEEDNWTIDTFVECATRVSKLGSDYVGAFVPLENACNIFGVKLVEYKDSKFINNVGNDQVAAACRWLMNGVDSKIFNPIIGNEDFAKFTSGKTGMVAYSDYGLRISGPFRAMDSKDMGYLPMPKVSASDEHYPVSNSLRAYGICKGARNAEAAAYFLRYFLDYENYNKNDVFISEEASDFAFSMNEMNHNPLLGTSNGVLCILDGLSDSAAKYYKTITDSSAAQVATNLKSFSNNIEACVKEANDIIDRVGGNQ